MTQWIGAIARGHNGGACLLKDGEVVFNIEEERLTRNKYDGAPLASITQFKKYTDKLDYLLIAHTTPLTSQPDLRLDYCLDDPYFGMVRKLGLMLTPEPDTCPDFFDMERGDLTMSLTWDRSITDYMLLQHSITLGLKKLLLLLLMVQVRG